MRTGAGRTRLGRAVAVAAAACAAAGAALAPAVAGGDAVEDFDGSWADRALELQYDLGSDLQLVNAPFVGTHNSFNSAAELGSGLAEADSNQRLDLTDQLDLGIRSLELDLHRVTSTGPTGFTDRPVVCHTVRGGGGCGPVKELEPVLAEISAWLRGPEGSEQVLLLYLEDDLDTVGTHDLAAASIEEELGDLVYRPEGEGCTELPATELTRADVVAAGKQVLIVSGCGKGTAWQSLAHSWELHRESRPFAFEDVPACGPDYSRTQYDRRLIRYYEDSTRTGEGTGPVDDGLTPATVAAMARCGVDLVGFDQLEPFDGRLEASVWSWRPDEPSGGRCAVIQLGADELQPGRWVAETCAPLRLNPACLSREDGSWIVPRRPVSVDRAAAACKRREARWAVPRTGHEDQLLRQAMRARGVRSALLGYRDGREGWAPLDRR